MSGLQWACPACTFLNSPDAKICSMCRTARPDLYKLPSNIDDKKKENLANINKTKVIISSLQAIEAFVNKAEKIAKSERAIMNTFFNREIPSIVNMMYTSENKKKLVMEVINNHILRTYSSVVALPSEIAVLYDRVELHYEIKYVNYGLLELLRGKYIQKIIIEDLSKTLEWARNFLMEKLMNKSDSNDLRHWHNHVFMERNSVGQYLSILHEIKEIKKKDAFSKPPQIPKNMFPSTTFTSKPKTVDFKGLINFIVSRSENLRYIPTYMGWGLNIGNGLCLSAMHLFGNNMEASVVNAYGRMDCLNGIRGHAKLSYIDNKRLPSTNKYKYYGAKSLVEDLYNYKDDIKKCDMIIRQELDHKKEKYIMGMYDFDNHRNNKDNISLIFSIWRNWHDSKLYLYIYDIKKFIKEIANNVYLDTDFIQKFPLRLIATYEIIVDSYGITYYEKKPLEQKEYKDPNKRHYYNLTGSSGKSGSPIFIALKDNKDGNKLTVQFLGSYSYGDWFEAGVVSYQPIKSDLRNVFGLYEDKYVNKLVFNDTTKICDQLNEPRNTVGGKRENFNYRLGGELIYKNLSINVLSLSVVLCIIGTIMIIGCICKWYRENRQNQESYKNCSSKYKKKPLVLKYEQVY